MAEKLDWLDREYLSHYDRQPVDSEIHYQKPFDAPKDREIFYPITEDFKSWSMCFWTRRAPF